MQLIIGNMLKFHLKISQPKFFNFVVFPAVCVQFLKIFVAKEFQNTQTRTN